MKIAAVDGTGSQDRSPKCARRDEIGPEISTNSLIVVSTDTGLAVIGSVFTDHRLVEAALGVRRVWPNVRRMQFK